MPAAADTFDESTAAEPALNSRPGLFGLLFSNSKQKAGSQHPDTAVAVDMAIRGLWVLPILLAIVWVLSDAPAAYSAGYGAAIVITNLVVSAYLLRWAAQISVGLVASIALGGYAFRLSMIFIAVWLVKDSEWIKMVPLGIAIITTHLGLLVWELRYVSATFAHPGLKPKVRSAENVAGSGNLVKKLAGVRPKPAAGYASVNRIS